MAVSLASWSRSGTNRALEPMYKRETTFDSMQDEIEKRSYAKLFISKLEFFSHWCSEELLLEKLYGKDNDFMKKLLESRWYPIRNIFEVKIRLKIIKLSKELGII